MTINEFGILLILVEKIKRDIAQTWEVIERTTGSVETTNKLIWWPRKRTLERTTVRIKNKRRKDKEDTGTNYKMNEDAWEDLDTWERRDGELIREHLNDAPVRFENDNWKLRMNNMKWWTLYNQTDKTLELLRIGEKNLHKQNN